MNASKWLQIILCASLGALISLTVGIWSGVREIKVAAKANGQKLADNATKLAKMDQQNWGETAAMRWAQHIPTATGVTCVAMDLNGDGYLSCSVFRGSELPIAIECASEERIQSGCRLPVGQAPTKKD